jgi:hypothetical protein
VEKKSKESFGKLLRRVMIKAVRRELVTAPTVEPAGKWTRTRSYMEMVLWVAKSHSGNGQGKKGVEAGQGRNVEGAEAVTKMGEDTTEDMTTELGLTGDEDQGLMSRTRRGE